jgi:hypothetical protein
MHNRRLSSILVALAAPAFLPAPAFAQATGDQARLIFTLSAGVVGGKKLWAVGAQPVRITDPADTLALERRVRSTLAVALGGSYFPGEHFGIGAEGFLIGLGYEDQCNQVFSSGLALVTAACQAINAGAPRATSVVVSGGPIFRVNSRKPLSPYARFNAGLIFSNQSSVRMTGQFPSPDGPVNLIVYSDTRESRVDPAFALGAGFTAAVAKGYQLRWEVRDNLIAINRVTGPAAVAGTMPPHERVFKHIFSMTIGVDVVLERRRGRRY